MEIAYVVMALAFGAFVALAYVLDRGGALPALVQRLRGSRNPVPAMQAAPEYAEGNYEAYVMSRAERAMSIAAAAAFCCAAGYLFYKHLGICALLGLTAFYYPRIRIRQLIRRRKEELKRQFKHALYSISSSLSAGKSVENAFVEAVNDLKLLYPDPRTDMLRELVRINRLAEHGEPVEKSLLDFGRRSGVEEVKQFAETFAVCKRTGGDLNEVMRGTAALIGEKLEIEQDIAVTIAQKKFEAKALGIIPFGLVAFLAFTSPDYMEPLYSGAGRAVMTSALVVLAVSQWIAWRIMNIRM